MSRAAQIAAFIFLGVAAASTGLMAADDAPAATFVSLKLEGACDAQNNRLWLTNTHTFKTVATTVRWRAAGGKDLTDQFYPGTELGAGDRLRRRGGNRRSEVRGFLEAARESG